MHGIEKFDWIYGIKGWHWIACPLQFYFFFDFSTGLFLKKCIRIFKNDMYPLMINPDDNEKFDCNNNDNNHNKYVDSSDNDDNKDCK